MYRKTGKFEWMKLYINQDVMEIQAIIILRSQGVKGEIVSLAKQLPSSFTP